MKALIPFALFALLTASLALAQVTCTIENAASCSTGTKYLGLENDTGGTINAHLQNYTVGTYQNSLCCETSYSTLDRDCSDETLLVLSEGDNAHAENDTAGNYAVPVCIGLADTDLYCRFVNGSCLGTETCQLSLTDTTDAHAGPCGEYDISVCCSITNTPPTVPTLLLPADGNTSVFERYTYFDWNASTDAEADPIHYQIAITAPAGCAAIPTRNLTPSEYTSVDELCLDQAYNWSVRACDDSDLCSDWASDANFTIASVVDLAFTSNTTAFGELDPSTPGNTVADDTLDDAPTPLVLENRGNVNISVQLRAADPLWTLASLNTSAFQYADENTSAWADMSDAYSAFLTSLAYGADREIELRIEVPLQEPPGVKQSAILALGSD